MTRKCEACSTTHGQIEWHHPKRSSSDGLFLCQPCHSLIQGRKRPTLKEMGENRSLEHRRADLLILVAQRTGIPIPEMDKH